MLPFQNLITTDKNILIPVFKQITNRLISLVQEGRIRPGTFLPGTRHMAEMIRVNRKTIIKVYDELIAQNWLESIPRIGYRVIPDLPVVKPRSFQPKSNFTINQKDQTDFPACEMGKFRSFTRIDLIVDGGNPDQDLAPYKKIGKAYVEQNEIRKLNRLPGFEEDGGLKILKRSTSNFLNDTRGLNICPEELLITSGTEMQLYIAATLLLRPGDSAAVCEPNYFLADEIIGNTGANIVRIKIDHEGIDTDHLEEVLQKTKLKMLYIVPHQHYPTTVTMSAARRVRLLELLALYDFWVIEDDYEYDFHYQNSPILPLASAAHGGKIIYIGSFSKILCPSIRAGFLVASRDIVKKAVHLQRLIDLHGNSPIEYLLSQMIDSGDLTQHIKKSNKLYAQKCSFFCDLLERSLGEAVEFARPSGGMAVWLRFDDRYPVSKIIKQCAELNLFLTGMYCESKDHINGNGLRLGFSSLSDKQMKSAVETLQKVINKMCNQREKVA